MRLTYYMLRGARWLTAQSTRRVFNDRGSICASAIYDLSTLFVKHSGEIAFPTHLLNDLVEMLLIKKNYVERILCGLWEKYRLVGRIRPPITQCGEHEKTSNKYTKRSKTVYSKVPPANTLLRQAVGPFNVNGTASHHLHLATGLLFSFLTPLRLLPLLSHDS